MNHGRLGTAESEERRRVRELEETVRMKNKQIHQLLEDIDQVEKDGVEFQNKVSRFIVKIIDFINSAAKSMLCML